MPTIAAPSEAPTPGQWRRGAIGVDPALLTATPEQQELRTFVARFLAEVSGADDVRRHSGLPAGYDPAVWRRVTGELGLAAIAVPARYGGAGSSFRDLAIVLEEAGQRLLCAPLLPSVVLACTAILASGDDAAGRRHLPGIADGSTVATLAGTAGRGGAGANGRRGAGGWWLDGAVDFVLSGACADVILLLAATGRGPTLFEVAGDAEGLTRTPRAVLDGTRPQARLQLRDVPATLVGPAGGGAAAVRRALDVGRAALAAEQVGATGQALHECVAFVSQRRQFGRPIGAFQAVKHRLADLLVELEGARSAARYAAACVDSCPDELPLAASVAQVACSEALELAAREYVQLHGGIGFTWEHPAHLYVRRARADAVLFGTAARHRARVAELIGLGEPGPSGAGADHG